MSLHENTPSIVRIDILVGSRPAGSTGMNDKALGPVDRSADRGSIFHRRSARPGPFLTRPRQRAWLAPIFIPNSPLNAPLPVSPHRSPSASRTMRASPGGSPLPPPASLLACLPDFPACNATRCGSPCRLDYHINGEELDLGYDDATGVEGKDEWGYCHLCDDYELRKMMHKLPCGHIICPYDLREIARNAVETAKSDDPHVRIAIDGAASELGRLKRRLAPRGTMPGTRAGREARMAALRKELLELLGLSCCGQDMHLARDWLLCLDEWLARELWAVTWRLLRGGWMDATMYCGWCRAAIPIWCCYNGWDGDRRWYCVACEGNSMFHHRDQDLWPAR